MLELLSYIISHIVSDPKKVKIDREDNADETVLLLKIPEEERGAVIGKDGMNIKAIRNLVSVIARRENKKVYIKIVD